VAKSFQRLLVEPHELLLDISNPRFGLSRAASQDEALEMLVRGARIKELWDSINSQGWIDFEPLVALSEKVEDNWVVIEGNRRVAAIQTLLEPDRLPPALAKRVPQISALALATLTTNNQKKPINVLLVENRHDADSFIGFKHVNGPASWGSLAKAKFAQAMFQRLVDKTGDREAALVAVQEALGDTNSTSIVRMIMAYKVFEQAISNDFISDEKLDDGVTGFSHLYTMMPNPASRVFLGLGEKAISADSITDDPVPPKKLENLNLMIGWLFGNGKADKVIKSQGTDRPKLQKVLAAVGARETLIATGDLIKAVSELGLDVDDWRGRLTKLEKQAKDLSTDLFDLQDELEPDIAEDAYRRALSAERACKSIARTLKDSKQTDLFESD
tara:strand:- start:3767 stop:4927 length:1161 start_codon:yes stop_codon:yes gene_type:complete